MSEIKHGITVVKKNDEYKPMQTAVKTTIGIVLPISEEAHKSGIEYNQPFLILGSRKSAAMLDPSHSGIGMALIFFNAIFNQSSAKIVVIPVKNHENNDVVVSNVIGGVDSEGNRSGLSCLEIAESKFGLKPGIIVCPGYSSFDPVRHAMAKIAEKLGAFCYCDIADGTIQSVAAAGRNNTYKNCMMLYPSVHIYVPELGRNILVPPSALAAGLRVKIDENIGWNRVLSNNMIHSVSAVSKDLSWSMSNFDTDVSFLNNNKVTCVVQRQNGGFYFWGCRTGSDDELYKYESTVRTESIVEDTLVNSLSYLPGTAMSQGIFENVIESANAKIRELVSQKLLVGGECYMDPDLNTNDIFSQGKAWWNVRISATPPLEQAGIILTMTNQYLVDLLPEG